MAITQNVGTFGIGSGILALLIKSLVANSLNKDLEAFKSTLSKDVETFKSNLQLATIEHHVRYSKLHEDRAQVIKELYGKLVDLDLAIYSVLKYFQPVGESSIEDKVKEYGRLHDEFNKFLIPNRIYFGVDTCKVIDSLLLLSRDTFFDITTYPVSIHDPQYVHGPRELLTERAEYWEKARKVFDTDIKELKEKIETQFREMLGVKD